MNETPISARFFAIFLGGLLKTVKEKIIDIFLAALVLLYQLGRNQLSPEALRNNAWAVATPWVWLLSGIAAFHVCRTIVVLRREIDAETSPIDIPGRVRSEYPNRYGSYKPKLFFGSFAAIVILGIFSYSVYRLGSIAPAVEQKSSIAETAIFMECEMSGLPLRVPPHGHLDVIPLIKKRIQREHWGFYEVVNSSNVESDWPDKSLLGTAAKQNSVPSVYQCTVSNHGPSTLIYVGIPIDLTFGDDKIAVRYSPVLSAMDAGKSSILYLINDCNMTVVAIQQQTARVQVLGEPQQRDVPLRRTYKSPVDQIMMFFPTTTRLIGGEPCD